jgi:hypothetical protein
MRTVADAEVTPHDNIATQSRAQRIGTPFDSTPSVPTSSKNSSDALNFQFGWIFVLKTNNLL